MISSLSSVRVLPTLSQQDHYEDYDLLNHFFESVMLDTPSSQNNGVCIEKLLLCKESASREHNEDSGSLGKLCKPRVSGTWY